MTFTRVQSASNGAVTASLALTLPNTPTQGNLLVACATSGAAITNPSGWTVTSRRDAQNCAVMYHKIAGANESKTLTLTQASNNIAGAIMEYAGNIASPFDVATNVGGTNDTGSLSITSASVTTTAANDLLVGAALIRASASAGNPTNGTWTGGLTNFVSRSDGTTASSNVTNYCFVGDALDAGAAGAHATVASWSSTQFKQRTAILAGFKVSAVSTVPTLASLNPTSGTESGGTTVILTGTNFTSASAVQFGATAATFIVNSATQITATAPANIGTGAVGVTVTTPSGTSNSVSYTYTPVTGGSPSAFFAFL